MADFTPAVETIDFDKMRKELGEGPMRFASEGERSIKDQIDSLAPEERECFENLKKKWEEKDDTTPFSDKMYLRFARCSPGATKFNEKTAWKVMKKFDRKYLSLKAADLEDQLTSKTLFPIPVLKSSDGHDMFYMRPSRYFPKETSTKQIIENLGYCMECMVEKEKACTEGIGFLAHMNDWKMHNFGMDYCFQFMMMLQGRVPARVRLFLIVNPPGWFDAIWKIMKPMLAKDFRKKVHMIPESDLHKFLMNDYEAHLPDDMEIGKAPTEGMVKDFIAYRKHMENL